MAADHNYIKMISVSAAAFLAAFAVTACTRYDPVALEPGFDYDALPETSEAEDMSGGETEPESEPETTEETEAAEEPDTRTPVKVKGIYLASKPLANESFMSTFWDYMDDTELNAVVIDVKDDYGKITYDIQDIPLVDELGAAEPVVEDMPSLMEKFKEHGIYVIARIVSMRDPYVGNVRPEWCLTNPDGTVYKDNSGYTWVNPYKTEYWDYLLDIAKQCARDGFNEIQFDYIRFCTDKGADDCIFDEEEVKGRDKISVITELASYLADNIKSEGVYVSFDVFGTIIGSSIDSRSVGQDYAQLASVADYMSPMIYPSHYSAGNFGLDMPDKHPYEAILGALKRSRSVLTNAQSDGQRQATVRPWLQSFTATWLGSGNYIAYGAEEVRQEIQAVYDAGYDEWILWSASVTYDYSGLLSDEEAEKEYAEILESRAAIPPEETAAETFPAELEEALDGDDLSEEDKAILEQDGPIITYEK